MPAPSVDLGGIPIFLMGLIGITVIGLISAGVALGLRFVIRRQQVILQPNHPRINLWLLRSVVLASVGLAGVLIVALCLNLATMTP